MLLLGEGDLSLAEALAAQAPPGLRLTASVLPGRDEWLRTYPASAKRLQRLEGLAASGSLGGGATLALHFRVDATRLHEAAAAGCLPACDRLAFTMPHTGECCVEEVGKEMHGEGLFWAGMETHPPNAARTGNDEDDDGHKRLMQDFFASAAAMLLRRAAAAAAAAASVKSGLGERGGSGGSLLTAPRCEVLLTLCNDQLSRWHAEAAARDAFWFMTGALGRGLGKGLRGRGLLPLPHCLRCLQLQLAAASAPVPTTLHPPQARSPLMPPLSRDTRQCGAPTTSPSPTAAPSPTALRSCPPTTACGARPECRRRAAPRRVLSDFFPSDLIKVARLPLLIHLHFYMFSAMCNAAQEGVREAAALRRQRRARANPFGGLLSWVAPSPGTSPNCRIASFTASRACPHQVR